MIIPIVSYGFDATGFAYQLHKEGNLVYLWLEKEKIRALENTGIRIFRKSQVNLEDFIRKNLKAPFIIFDGSEYGSLQDKLRSQGVRVVGSSSFGEKVERDRLFAVGVAKRLEVKAPETVGFDSIEEAVNFIKKNKGKWVVKQNGNLPKLFNYVGFLDSGEDVTYHLMAMKERIGDEKIKAGKFVLQRKVEGIEVATAGFFTPAGWLKTEKDKILLEVNFEHKGLLEGDRGPTTGEMGTVAFFAEGENLIFKKAVKPLTPLLAYFKNWGVVDANCIVNEEGIYLLEWTIRFGYPITELYKVLWNGKINLDSFIGCIATGAKVPSPPGDPRWGVIWILGFPIFPYEDSRTKYDSFLGEVLIIPEDVERRHFAPGFLSKRKIGDIYRWYISDTFGYALTVSYASSSLEEVIKRGVNALESIVPAKKGFYRTDIGKRVIEALKYDFITKAIFPS